MNHPTTLVIGAGLSGLLVAQRLHAAGLPVTLVEKSRGVGGRMATKRVGSAVFDQGAQFFTARSEAFAALAAGWQEQGLIQPWGGTSPTRYFGREGMTAVPKALAAGLELKREHQAVAVRHSAAGWEVDVENQPVLRSDRLVLTAPVPQSLALLKAGGTVLPEPVATELAQLTYHPCLALLVVLDEPSEVPAAGLAPEGGAIRWIADNTKKGISPGVMAAVTLHASAAFAEEHYGKTEAEVAARLLPEAGRWLRGTVLSATLHRWRYSESKVTFRAPCLWLPDWQLGWAGDAFGGPKVEGAALSGLAMAGRLLEL